MRSSWRGSRGGVAALALVGLTCTDDGAAAITAVRGVVMLSEPVVDARVEVVRFDGGVRGATLCETVTDAHGAYDCALGSRYGDLLVIASGGSTRERGATLALPPGAVLRAPAWGVTLQEERAVTVSPLSEVVVAVGLARAAAGADAGVAASLAAAHALVLDHVEVDPVAVTPASLDAATSLTEAVKLALALRGLATLAAAVAAEQALTPQALSSRTLLDRLVDDARSAEARLDGVGPDGALVLGPACRLPDGCAVEGTPGCVALCVVQTNTLRARLGGAVLAFLRSPDNRTGLTRDDALPWATHLQQHTSALFGAAAVEPLDAAGPTIAFAAPADAAVFPGGTIALEVTAADALGVAALTVTAELPTPVVVVDTDPAPERFVGALAITAATPEGPLTFTATARDLEGNVTTAARTVAIDAVAGGSLSGVAVKARLGGADVAVYTFADGVRGASPVGTGTTAADGSFANVAIADGVAGPLLVEVRGGSYGEDSQPATLVTLDTTDRLRTVIPAFVDGSALSGVVVSPLSELAVAYLGWLHGAGQGGATLAARWATAHAGIEQLLGVASIVDVVPSAPAQIDTLTAADRFGLVLVGLSRVAWAASTSGGGDAGAFGPTVHAMTVVTAWSRDLADGCLDGKAGATALSYGGTAALTDEALRLHLAQAIVAYLGDSARNATAFTTPAEVLPLLDTLARGGGNAMPGSCVASGPGTVGGHLFDDDGRSFDRDGPVVTFDGATPAAGALVRGTIAVDATAFDALDPAPSLRFVEPAGTVDTDGDPTDRDAHASFDTTALADGPLVLGLDAVDHSGNHGAAARTFTIDNTPPSVTWATGGLLVVGADHWTATATPTLTGTVADLHVGTVVASWPGGSVTATVVAGAWSVTLPAAALGLAGTDVTITATDRAGNLAALTRRLRADVTPPSLGFVTTTVRREELDSVTFDPAIDPATGVATLRPTHAHSAASPTTLGPATACDVASAPTVVKYAYLLDRTPRLALESGGADAGGGNSLGWQLAPSDDGVGLASVRWRVVAVDTGAVLRAWVTLAAPVATRVALHRDGVDGAPALGTTTGLLRLEVEATDRLARTSSVARCWNHTLLAAPIVLAPADQAALPTVDAAAGKWGLASLDLASTAVAAAPVSMMLTPGASTGAGLFEFPIYNPTDEPVFVSVELDLPTTATWTRSSYDGRWVYREAATTTSCGAVQTDPGPPATYEPDYALAGCESSAPSGNDPSLYTDTNQAVPTADFTVRAWTTDQLTPVLTELVPCVGCSTTPSTAGRVRTTFLVPPRGPDLARPPVKVVLMAALRPSSVYRPHGTQAADPAPIEFAVGSQRLTGAALATATQCVQWSRPPGSTSSATFQCTRTRYYTRARYLNAISVQGVSARTIWLATGLTGTSTRIDIPHLPLTAGQRTFIPPAGVVWSTGEPAPPAL